MYLCLKRSNIVHFEIIFNSTEKHDGNSNASLHWEPKVFGQTLNGVLVNINPQVWLTLGEIYWLRTIVLLTHCLTSSYRFNSRSRLVLTGRDLKANITEGKETKTSMSSLHSDQEIVLWKRSVSSGFVDSLTAILGEAGECRRWTRSGFHPGQVSRPCSWEMGGSWRTWSEPRQTPRGPGNSEGTERRSARNRTHNLHAGSRSVWCSK